MGKKKQKNEITSLNTAVKIDENQLFKRISDIIENRKSRAGSYVNQEITLMF